MQHYDELILRMMEYDGGMPHLIQHFLKVHAFARLIGSREGLDKKTQHILETAAIVHDIGIPPSLRVYGDDAGRHQEELGPAEAKKMLLALGYAPDVVARVSLLVGHHHTYTDILGIDHQILIEADFLVNLFENQSSREAVRQAYETIFATITGKALLRTQFSLTE
ncbi:MAG: HD domain-containing protein [Clostridiales bacterium]|nr:HD domain-containing protein [Clostridiales bacterium]